MKLNIQLFDGGDKELALNPSAFNAMISNYEGQLPVIDNAFANNKDALVTLKAVAGSPIISEQTRGIIRDLTDAIDETANYFDSVKNWANDVVSTVHSILGSVGLNNTSSSIKRETLDEIEESFEGGFVGIQSASDVDNFVSSIQTSVIPTLKNGLETITNDVRGANGSLPAEVHNNLGTTINTNNDDILESYSNASEFLTQQLESFKKELTNFVQSAADGARGSK